ncbi:MAG: prepilin-type N-terminal cleavage/methylation domain-containing protein [Candidatus Sumerlaeaceae bacterium]|nr:prepilin-type N-terminal cleavage/methylation domain-containing protein [Candidatus Sumerlaeaceae bacterium]
MKTLSPRRAVTLIEVLVALAVLSVGIFGIAELLLRSRGSAALAEIKMQAAGLGELKFEELRASGPALAAAISGLSAAEGEDLNLPADGPQAFEQNAKYVWRAGLRPDPANKNRVYVRVDVSQSGPAGNKGPVARIGGWVLIPKGGGGA